MSLPIIRQATCGGGGGFRVPPPGRAHLAVPGHHFRLRKSRLGHLHNLIVPLSQVLAEESKRRSSSWQPALTSGITAVGDGGRRHCTRRGRTPATEIRSVDPRERLGSLRLLRTFVVYIRPYVRVLVQHAFLCSRWICKKDEIKHRHALARSMDVNAERCTSNHGWQWSPSKP